MQYLLNLLALYYTTSKLSFKRGEITPSVTVRNVLDEALMPTN